MSRQRRAAKTRALQSARRVERRQRRAANAMFRRWVETGNYTIGHISGVRVIVSEFALEPHMVARLHRRAKREAARRAMLAGYAAVRGSGAAASSASTS